MAAAELLGTLTSQKEPFSHSDMSTIYSKSQWKFKITIELTFMDNIKTWKNTAKRMIDFLPVTWKCCFYSAHFQPGGLFNIAMDNGPFLDGLSVNDDLPIRNCDFPYSQKTWQDDITWYRLDLQHRKNTWKNKTAGKSGKSTPLKPDIDWWNLADYELFSPVGGKPSAWCKRLFFSCQDNVLCEFMGT